MFDFDSDDIMWAIQLLVLFIVGALLIFFVLRPLVKATVSGGGMPMIAAATAGGTDGGGGGGGQGMAQIGASGAPALPPSEMDHRLDIARIEGQVKASSVRKVSEFVESHPDESTAILRSWVHEG
jgi:flagellar M-ring protein FliF